MAHSTSFANDLLDQELNNAASGTDVIGATTYTLPLRIRPTSTLCTDSASGTEWTGGSYVAGGLSLAGLVATAAASRSKSNTTAITQTGCPATTLADFAIFDSSGTPKYMTYKGTPSIAKTINAGDTLVIPIGSLTASYTAGA
jgi:hypothetical protein